jgi:DNA-binding transcriptional LysR family regulator
MQFEALKVFCDIAQCRSFSQAASLNDLTQSAASHIVSQLEKRLKIQLISRHTRPLQLTPLGQEYYEGCKSLVEQYLELEASILRAHAQLSASVRVAAIYSVGLGDMGQLAERFKGQQPHTKIHIEYLHPDRVYEQVLAGTADLGLVSFPRRRRDLVITPWRDEPMVLACPPSHPLAEAPAVRPAQLGGEKYVGFNRGLTIRREVDRFLRDRGVAVELAADFDNVDSIKQAVSVGVGVALLPEPTFRREVQAGVLVARPLQGPLFVRPVGIIRRRKHKLGPAAQRFLDFLRDNGAPNGETNGNGHARSPKRKS